MKATRTLAAAGLCLTFAVTANAQTPAEVVRTYADIAHAEYEDSLITARTLDAAIDALEKSVRRCFH